MRIGRDEVHYDWDNARAPARRVAPGSEITLELVDASGGQVRGDAGDELAAAFDLTRVNPVTGPIAIEGTEPGDAVIVEVLELEPAPVGWTANIPGFGLLAEDFPEPRLVLSRVGPTVVELGFGACLPTLAMIGTCGVALPQAGAHPILPPSRHGGNLDIRHLTAGATLVLPVGVSGALVSVGDAHGAMGDGEICGTGLEVAATARLRLDRVAGRAPAFPMLETAPGAARRGPALVTSGVGPDLFTAARDAARQMVEEIARRTGIAPVDAYLLASLAGDLHIAEIVDTPHWVVTFHLERSLLG